MPYRIVQVGDIVSIMQFPYTIRSLDLIFQSVQSFVSYSSAVDPILKLRGIASLAIIWFHLLPPHGWLVVGSIDVSFITSPSGLLMVYIFYLISGYGVGYGFFSKKYSLSMRSLGYFYINRLVRIVPAYYVCLVVCMVIFYPHVPLSIYDVVRFFTFTANYDYGSLPYQQLLAIISTEMQFYLVAPFLVFFVKHLLKYVHPIGSGIAIMCIGGAIKYALSYLGFIYDEPMFLHHVYVNVLGVIDYFLFGIFLSYLVHERRVDILALKKWIHPVIYWTFFIGWLLWVNRDEYLHIPWESFIVGQLYLIPISTCVLVGWYILSSSVGRTYQKLEYTPSHVFHLIMHPRTFLYGMGYVSYGLYLYHYALFDVLYSKPGLVIYSVPAFVSRVIVISSITITVSYVSYAIVEYPMLWLKKVATHALIRRIRKAPRKSML